MKKYPSMECFSTFFEKRDNYIYLRYKQYSSVDLDEAKEHAKILLKLCDGTRYPFILDGLNITAKFTKEARDFFSNHSPLLDLRLAQAFLINNTPNRLLLKFYLKFHPPSNPVKIFNNLPDAEQWIKQFNPISL